MNTNAPTPPAATERADARAAATYSLGGHLRAGDRVLVSEARGLEWHTVTEANAFWVKTEEVPTGFRRDFVVDVQRQGECESCRRPAGSPCLKTCG